MDLYAAFSKFYYSTTNYIDCWSSRIRSDPLEKFRKGERQILASAQQHTKYHFSDGLTKLLSTVCRKLRILELNFSELVMMDDSFIYQEFIIRRLALAVYDHTFKTKQK